MPGNADPLGHHADEKLGQLGRTGRPQNKAGVWVPHVAGFDLDL